MTERPRSEVVEELAEAVAHFRELRKLGRVWFTLSPADRERRRYKKGQLRERIAQLSTELSDIDLGEEAV